MTWAPNQLGLLLDTPAKAAGLAPRRAEIPRAAPADPGFWIETACAHLGLEAEAVRLFPGNLIEQLRSAAPVVIQAPQGYLALLRMRGGRACLIDPDLNRHTIRESELAAILLDHIQAPHRAEIEA